MPKITKKNTPDVKMMIATGILPYAGIFRFEYDPNSFYSSEWAWSRELTKAKAKFCRRMDELYYEFRGDSLTFWTWGPLPVRRTYGIIPLSIIVISSRGPWISSDLSPADVAPILRGEPLPFLIMWEGRNINQYAGQIGRIS